MDAFIRRRWRRRPVPCIIPRTVWINMLQVLEVVLQVMNPSEFTIYIVYQEH
jgi:hypothetical protein